MFAEIALGETLALAALGILLVVGAAVLVWLLAGLFTARSLIRREFSAYFLSPIAYVVLVVFLFITGILFNLTANLLTASGPKGVDDPMRFMFGDERFWLVFLFIPPLLTMRLFAEERGSGTLEVLMTAPLRDWQLVLGKYLACFAFYVFLWLPTLAYLPVLLNMHDPVWAFPLTPYPLLFVGGAAAMLLGLLVLLPPLGTRSRVVALALLAAGAACVGVGAWGQYPPGAPRILTITYGIDPMPVLSSYLGLLLVGAMFLALGLFVSSLVRSQMVAALLSLVLSLLFIIPGYWRPDMDTGSDLYQVWYFFGVPLHFSHGFGRGLVDTRHLVLYASVAVFCLFLTVRSLEVRRWR